MLLLISIISGYADENNIHKFSVGPYTIIYDITEEQVRDTTLDNTIDLYKFYNLKRDTTIIYDTEKLKHGVQINVFMGTPSFDIKGSSIAYGLSGAWKQQIGDIFYLNTGLSVGVSNGEYSNNDNLKSYYRKDMMLEIGIPILMELTNLNTKKSSLYAGIGFTPTYYKTIKVEEESSMDKTNSGKKDSGILVSPRIDFGGYIPFCGKTLRVGIYGEYKICCSQNMKIYKKRISRAYIGANVGFVF